MQSVCTCSTFVHLCDKPTVFCTWQLFGPGLDTHVSCWLLGDSDWPCWVVGSCQKSNSNNSLPCPVLDTQLWWCQAALSTVAGNHTLNNRQLQHTALPLSPQHWPGWLAAQLHSHNWRKNTHTRVLTEVYDYKLLKANFFQLSSLVGTIYLCDRFYLLQLVCGYQ